MISGVEGRGLECWGHLSLEGERRSNSNETNLPSPRCHLPPLTVSSTPTFFSCSDSIFSKNHFSPSPAALYLHILSFFFYRWFLPLVKPYCYLLLSLAIGQTHTNAVVVGDSLAFCDKQRFMSSLFIFF